MMIRKLARKILKNDIDSMSETIESLRESNNTLRKEIDDFADVKLRLKVAEMYIDDSDAIDELLAAKKEKNRAEAERYNNILTLQGDRSMAVRAAAMRGQANLGMTGMIGASCCNFGNLLGGPYG